MKKNKISLKHGYTLTINEDDKVFLKVETEDDILEFDGIKGNLMDASDFETHYTDEDIEYTVTEYRNATLSFLTDWGVDREAAEAIIEELTPWFERYAIKQPKADAWEKVLEDRVENLKRKEALYKENISNEAERFKKWVSNASEYDIVDSAVYMAQLVKDAREAYRAIWQNYKEAERELFNYRQTMHI